MKQVIKKILSKYGYCIIPSEMDIHNDPIVSEFDHIYEQSKPFSQSTKERMYCLYKAVRYIIQNSIEGDFVECGVWKGGSALVIALTQKELKDTRPIWLYDTYEGMAGKSEFDKPNVMPTNGEGDWLSIDLMEVQINLSRFSNIKYIKGMVEDTIPENMPDKISLLRLDTDWYNSTKHELEHLYPLLTKGGVLLLDDYGWWAGAKKAVDEYIGNDMLLNRIDVTGRIGVKYA